MYFETIHFSLAFSSRFLLCVISYALYTIWNNLIQTLFILIFQMVFHPPAKNKNKKTTNKKLNKTKQTNKQKSQDKRSFVRIYQITHTEKNALSIKHHLLASSVIYWSSVRSGWKTIRSNMKFIEHNSVINSSSSNNKNKTFHFCRTTGCVWTSFNARRWNALDTKSHDIV